MVDYNPDDPATLETVFQNIDPVLVHMAHDLLQEAGIDAFILDGESSRMLGTTSAVESRLVVHADSVAEARSRLKELGFT
jgi:Putative prokaryotic signal transducing protein